MKEDPLAIRAGDAPEVQAFLDARIYEFNSQATGYFDGESFSSTRLDASGVIRAGTYGYTWGGCAYVSYLWVDESQRGRGIGSALLAAVETYARSRGCEVIFLATHSFQAPGFYDRLGYTRQSILHDHPVGHSSLVFAKRLQQGSD
jgi:ribosomal protein S18 acetylase RimI-like enzyme